MSEIINLKTRKEKKDNAQGVKEERQNTISFLKRLIKTLEKENLDPEDCIVMVSYEDSRDKIFNSESHDIFYNDISSKNILGLIELVKHNLLNQIDRT